MKSYEGAKKGETSCVSTSASTKLSRWKRGGSRRFSGLLWMVSTLTIPHACSQRAAVTVNKPTPYECTSCTHTDRNQRRNSSEQIAAGRAPLNVELVQALGLLRVGPVAQVQHAGDDLAREAAPAPSPLSPAAKAASQCSQVQHSGEDLARELRY